MTSLLARIALMIFAVVECSAAEGGVAADRAALEKTSVEIRAAFAKGDVEAIAKYHHPRVEKALSYTKSLKGREAVMADLRGVLAAYSLTFVEHRVESLEFFGDTCVEQTVFAIRGEPKGDGQPFVFRGRALVVYIRSPESPTGWASLREIIQPAAE
jgi:ketosteroid isomerase-like protein